MRIAMLGISNFQVCDSHNISNRKFKISDLTSQVSSLRSQISNFKFQISNFKSQIISNLKFQISNSKSRDCYVSNDLKNLTSSILDRQSFILLPRASILGTPSRLEHFFQLTLRGDKTSRDLLLSRLR